MEHEKTAYLDSRRGPVFRGDSNPDPRYVWTLVTSEEAAEAALGRGELPILVPSEILGEDAQPGAQLQAITDEQERQYEGPGRRWPTWEELQRDRPPRLGDEGLSPKPAAAAPSARSGSLIPLRTALSRGLLVMPSRRVPQALSPERLEDQQRLELSPTEMLDEEEELRIRKQIEEEIQPDQPRRPNALVEDLESEAARISARLA